METVTKQNVQFDNIPDDLAELDHWILWTFEEKRNQDKEIVVDENGEIQYTKVPKQPNGSNANSTNLNTWNTLEAVEEALKSSPEQFDGIGFVFTDSGIVGIDIDNKDEELQEYLSNDEVDLDTNTVADFIETTKSYAEVSPSGNGIHIYMKGSKPEGKSKNGNFEMYDTKRFFTVTGNRISERKQLADNEELNVLPYLHDKYINKNDDKNPVIDVQQVIENAGNGLSDEDIIQKIIGSKQREKFMKLFTHGDVSDYPSRSDADYALISILRWWTNNDIEQIDRIFRESALMRDKWDRPTGNSTYGINSIIQNIKESKGDGYKSNMKKYDFQMNDERKWYPYDDTGNAEMFTDLYKDQIRYSYEAKSWYYYTGKIWEPDNLGKVQQLADKIPDKIAKQPIRVTDTTDKKLVDQAQKDKTRHLKNSRNYKGKNDFIKESQHRVSIAQGDFDNAGNKLNLQNGYYDLDKDEFKEHDRSLYLTKITNIQYDSNAKAPKWEQFINETFLGDIELIDYVQRAVGYSLSNSTEERVMFFMYGKKGSNGKSVFTGMLSELLNDYHENVNSNALMNSKDSDSSDASPALAKLKGARLVTASETEKQKPLNVNLVKLITGNDIVTARYLHKNEISYTPEFKVWLATNHKPVIDGDPAIWGRLVVIPFDNYVPDRKADKELSNKLKKEMSGILNWAIEGHRKYKEAGLRDSEPVAIKEQREEYKEDMDVIGTFINDWCIIDDEHKIKSSSLWRAFNNWAETNGEDIAKETNKSFSSELINTYGLDKKRFSDGWYFLGVQLNHESTQDNL